MEKALSGVKTDLTDLGLWVEVFDFLFDDFDFLFEDFDFVGQKMFAFALELFDSRSGFTSKLAGVFQQIFLGVVEVVFQCSDFAIEMKKLSNYSLQRI